MSVILILLAASLSIAICFLFAFIWSVKSGQYDDDYTPSVRMLFDELPADSRAREVLTGCRIVKERTVSSLFVKIGICPQDAKGSALFARCSDDAGSGQKSRNEVKPEAARPGAQNIKIKSDKNNQTSSLSTVLTSARINNAPSNYK